MKSLDPSERVPVTSGHASGSNGEAGVVRVMCVDDHALLVEGLKAQFAIQGRARIVGHLQSADGLLAEVARLGPDVVLLDIEMPGADAFEAADRLRRTHPQARVIFLSAHIREAYLAAAYECGAAGYFAKSCDPAAIVEGVLSVANGPDGTFVMGRKVRERCAPDLQTDQPVVTTRTRPVTRLDALSPREMEVLRLIGKGLSCPQIASELCRSIKTIESHQHRVMIKLGLASRSEAMRFAIREGLAEV